MPLEQMNSAGSLVGAILETAGYYYQGHILEKLGKPLTESIGALIYLFGVAVAVFHIAVLRSSKMGIWLFLGPPIFFAILNDRVEIQDAVWSFGSNARNQVEVKNGKQDIVGEDTTPRVSRVFKRYIEMIGGSVKEIVNTINGVQIENDLWFIAKGQLYGYMTTAMEEDVGLRQLIHYGLTGLCFQAVEAAEGITDPLRRTNPRGPEGKAISNSRRFKMPTIRSAQERYNDIMTKTVNFKNNSEVRNYLTKLGIEISDKNSDMMFRCQDIWQIVLFGIKQKAEYHKEKMDRGAERLGIDVEAIDNLIGQASGIKSTEQLLSSKSTISDSASKEIIKVISKYYLRNELNSPDRGSLLANFASRNDIRKIHMKMQGEFSASEKAGLNAGEWGYKENIMYVASSLPTFQGLILYFLGVTFPFFALLLLIPGKAQGFLIWFALWLWAKSWDIGLAIVMQLDTIFWSLYVVQKQKLSVENTGDTIDAIANNLDAAIAALHQMDPTFQMGSYYNLLAVALNAVPIITANLILGGMKGGSGLIAQGVSRYADFFGEAAMVRAEQGAITQMKSDAIQLKSTRGLAYSLGGAKRDEVLSKRGREDPNAQVRDLWSKNESTFSPAVGYTNISKPANFSKERYAGALGIADKSGFASGISGPGKILSQGMGNGIPNSVLNLAYLSDKIIGKEQLDQAFKTASKDAAAQIAQAEWESSIERQAYELHYKMSIYRAIPVPWTFDGNELSAAEVDRHITDFQNKVGMIKAHVNTIHSGVSEISTALGKDEPEDPKSQNSPQSIIGQVTNSKIGKTIIGGASSIIGLEAAKQIGGNKSKESENNQSSDILKGNFVPDVPKEKQIERNTLGTARNRFNDFASTVFPDAETIEELEKEKQFMALPDNSNKNNFNPIADFNKPILFDELPIMMREDLSGKFAYDQLRANDSQSLNTLEANYQSFEDKFNDSSRYTDTRNVELEDDSRRIRQRDISKPRRNGQIDRNDKPN